MRPLLLVTLAALLSLASGCIVWNSYLEPGVDRFPESLAEVRPAPVRLQVAVKVPPPDGKKAWAIDPDASARLAELVNETGIVSEAATELALAEGRVDVKLTTMPLGHPGLALLSVLTVGVVPYYGGRRVTAEATLLNSKGEEQATWTAVAEARLVGSIVFLAGWNLDALNDLRDDALRGVVVKLAHEQRRLLQARAPSTPPTGGRRRAVARVAAETAAAPGDAKHR